jgi:hypothetical protein
MGISSILIENGYSAACNFLLRDYSSNICSKREHRAAVFSYAPPGECENSQQNDTVVTQTAQHDLTADHEAHDPAVNLPNTKHCIQPDGNSTRSLTPLAKNYTPARIIERSLRRSKTNEIRLLTLSINLRPSLYRVNKQERSV